MRHPLRTALIVLALAASLPVLAEDAALENSLPEDIPDGRESAAASLRSGVPQLVSKVLGEIVFAQEPPVFLPWRTALEGKASEAAGEAWSVYAGQLRDEEVNAAAFYDEATLWFEGQTDMPVLDSARLTSAVRANSEILSKRHMELARGGNMYALFAMSNNPAAHPALIDLCKSDATEASRFNCMMAAFHARSIAFRPLFEEWFKMPGQQESFFGLNGLLQLGAADAIPLARAYFHKELVMRPFEVYRSLSCVKTKEAVDLLLEQIPAAAPTNRKHLLDALSREKDDRILPKLRELRDSTDFTPGVCRGLKRVGRAADVPWLLVQMEGGEQPFAATTLRRLIGKGCPIAFVGREDAVAKWIEEHKAEVEKDAELPLK